MLTILNTPATTMGWGGRQAHAREQKGIPTSTKHSYPPKYDKAMHICSEKHIVVMTTKKP